MTLDTENQMIEAIGDWERTKGALPPVIALYRQLLSLQVEAAPAIKAPFPNLDMENRHNRLKSGQPLLRFSEIPVEWNLFRSLFRQAYSVLSSYPEFKDVPRCPKGLGVLRALSESWYQGESSNADERQWGILGLAIQTALKPFLDATRQALLKDFSLGSWLRNYCPVCGGNPDFAFLDKDRGARHLVCARCDSEWVFKRLECRNCGNQDQNTLAYYTDDVGRYRLYVCEACKDYLKAVDLRITQIPVFIPLERFITLDLDAQARRNGYVAHKTGRVYR